MYCGEQLTRGIAREEVVHALDDLAQLLPFIFGVSSLQENSLPRNY